MTRIRTDTKEDYYGILEITPNASGEEIKGAYRRLALCHHPDRNKGSLDSEEKTKLLNEAYEVLSDPAKRVEYDAVYFPQIAQERAREARARQEAETRKRREEERARQEAEYRKKREEERLRREAEERRREEETEKRRQILWREIRPVLAKYFDEIPGLEEKFKRLDLDVYYSRFKEGEFFWRDLGIFQHYADRVKEVSSQELQELIRVTEYPTQHVCRINLPCEKISGMKLRIDFTPHEVNFAFSIPDNLLTRGDGIKYTQLKNSKADPDNFKSGYDIETQCNFVSWLMNSIKAGNYQISFSNDLPKNHLLVNSTSYNFTNWNGLWIDRLVLQDTPIVVDGRVRDLEEIAIGDLK